MNSPIAEVSFLINFPLAVKTISFIYASCISGGTLSFNLILKGSYDNYATRSNNTSLSIQCPDHERTAKLFEYAMTDIITLTDEYDYIAMRRFSQIIKYNTKHISLVTNRGLSTTIPPLTLLSILETLNSPSSFGMALDFLREFKETSEGSGNNQNPEDFRILLPKEVQNISDRMSHMQYSIIRDSRNKGERPLKL